MRHVLMCVGLIVGLLGCSSDRPTSFQELIFDSWAAVGDRTTFRSIAIKQGSSPLAGTYVARVVTGQNEQTGDPIIADESGTLTISGSVVIFTRPGIPQPQQFTWSIDAGVLTLRGGGFGTESYRRG